MGLTKIIHTEKHTRGQWRGKQGVPEKHTMVDEETLKVGMEKCMRGHGEMHKGGGMEKHTFFVTDIDQLFHLIIDQS